MRIKDLEPGMQFAHPMFGDKPVTFIANVSPHPYYGSEFNLVIWRLPDGELSLDALVPEMSVNGTPLPGSREIWRSNVKKAIGIR